MEIVSRAYDRTNDASSVGTNNGIYRMSWQVFDSSGMHAVTQKKTPYTFDNIPASDNYITNVYFEGSDQSTYIYTPTNPISGDGYWDTRNLDPGMYRVMVEVEDTRGHTAQRWVSVQVTEADDSPPPQPVFTSVTGDSTGMLTLRWAAMDTSDIAGFNLEFSYDGKNWTENDALSVSIAPGDTLLSVDFTMDKGIFFRLRTYDDAAIVNYSPWSDVYGVRAAAQPPPLAVVDGFDGRNGYWINKNHDFALRYGLALENMSRGWDTYADDAVKNAYAPLNAYPVVLYFTGDDGANNDSALTKEEMNALDNYMRGSGHLIVSGSGHYAQALNGDTQAMNWYEAHFYNSGGALITADSVIGEPGSVLEGFKAAITIPDNAGASFHGVEADSFAKVLLRFNDDARTPAVIFKARNQSNDEFHSTALTFAAFPLELIEDDNTRMRLIRELIRQDAVTTVEPFPLKPNTLRLYANYPNPFNPETTLHYTLKQAGETELTVYDARGRRVRVLFRGRQQPGDHKIVFDAAGLASGVYYYRLRSAGQTLTRKMLLLR